MDRQKDRRTDILRQHSPRYAQHRAVKVFVSTSAQCRRIRVCTRHCHDNSLCDKVPRNNDDRRKADDEVDQSRYDCPSVGSSLVVPSLRRRCRSSRQRT